MEGFIINSYDPCVANKNIGGHQMTVTCYVDNLKISHKSPDVAIGVTIRQTPYLPRQEA